MRWIIGVAGVVAGLFSAAPAWADGNSNAGDIIAKTVDDMWKDLERLPPHHSWDLAVAPCFSDLTYWRSETPPWIGLGLRGGWGVHNDSGMTRYGIAGGLSLEGPVPEYFTGSFEPGVTVDHLAKWFQIGAEVGPTAYYHSHATTFGPEGAWGAGAEAAVRLGWSQPWSRVSRRMFVLLEPSVRAVQTADDGWQPDPRIALLIGSGRGY